VTVGRPGLRTTIIATVALVVLATTAALALVSYSVVRSDRVTFRAVDSGGQLAEAQNFASVERHLIHDVTEYAGAHPSSTSTTALTRFVQVQEGMPFMGVLDPLHASTTLCATEPCWAVLPPAALLDARMGRPFVGGGSVASGGPIRYAAVMPLGEGVGDGHLVLATVTPYFGTPQNDGRLWSRMAIVIGVGVLLSVLAGLLVAYSVRRPLRHIAAAAQRFGEGDLAAKAPQHGTDELAQLGTVFNTMAARLRQTVDELHSSREVERRFVADVSHELRTPLSTMVASLNALDSDSPSDRHRAGEMLSVQTRRLAELVDDLLEISRFDARQADLSIEVVDLAALVHDAAGDVAPDIEVSLTVIGSSMWSVDPRRMHTVMRNLIGNAVRHGLPPVAVTIDSTGSAGVRLQVIDDGPGIDPERAERIFNRFSQGDPSRSGINNGSGLGLAIARENVLLHGGTIHVSPTPPTRFTVTIPITGTRYQMT
jgi:two-component system sensor histidine kinase MtrB